MVWSGFPVNYRTPLHRVEGNLTGNMYRDDIVQLLVFPALQATGQDVVVQDDNARPHGVYVVFEFLQQHHVTRMDWPALSPDHNRLEHRWDILGRSARGNHLVIRTSCFKICSRSGRQSPTTLSGGWFYPWNNIAWLLSILVAIIFTSAANKSEFQKERCVRRTSNYSYTSSLFFMKLS